MTTLTKCLLLVLIWLHLGQPEKPRLAYYPGYIWKYRSNCEVKTSDGYCLEPLVLKKDGIDEIRGKAFLQHGLLGSGANWMLSGRPKKVSEPG